MSFASRQTDRHRPTDRPPTPPLHPPLFRCFPVIFAQCTAGRRGFVLKLSTRRTIGRRLAYPNKENSPSSHHPLLPAPRRLVVRCCRGPIRHPLPPSLSPLVTRQPIRPTTPRFFLLLFLLLPPPACQSRYPLRFRCCCLSVLRRRVSFSLCFSLVQDGYFRGREEREQVEFFNKIGTNRWSF